MIRARDITRERLCPDGWLIAGTWLFLLLVGTGVCHAADPEVGNVRVEQRRDGSQLADITYDVSATDTDTLTWVTVEVSADSGQTWTELTRVSGDVGEGVGVGRGKRIVWDIGAEFQNASGRGYQVRVVAEDRPPASEGMVQVPGGCFQMGDAFGEGTSGERPVHRVCVDRFYLDQYEVTNREYRLYASGHNSGRQVGLSLNEDDQPAASVSWWDAIRYCNWRSRQEGLEASYNETTGECDFNKNGYRLPTEAEWEYAARGGEKQKRYVWGDGPPPSSAASVANVADESAQNLRLSGKIFEGYNDGYQVAAPVGSFVPNGYGLYDMAGNVWEWCHDWYDADYYGESRETNPRGARTGLYRVMRSGSWDNSPYDLRVAYRCGDFLPGSLLYSGGFRCARPVD